MTWATAQDLLTGDLPLGNLDTGAYLNTAEDEINVVLGFVYELPIPTITDEHQESLLRLIHSRLASGRLIMAQAMSSEDEGLHAYGQSLVQMAFDQLAMIGTTVELEGAVSTSTGVEDQSPAVITPYSAPTTSPFDTYEAYVHGQAGSAYVDWPDSVS